MIVGSSPIRSIGFPTGLVTLSTPPRMYKLITNNPYFIIVEYLH